MYAFQLIALLVAVVAANAMAVSNSTVGKLNPDTVTSLDVPKYLGLWYQMASDKIVYDTFEKDAYCATALYGDNGDGTLSVHNYAKISSATGNTYVIDGYAYQSNLPDKPGQLKVKFDSSDAAPFPAPYWILQLGPINSKNQYDWAIVSDNLSSTLFILARDVAKYNAQYKNSVTKIVTDLGFTGFTKPIDMYHGSDCVYEATTRRVQMEKFEAK